MIHGHIDAWEIKVLKDLATSLLKIQDTKMENGKVTQYYLIHEEMVAFSTNDKKWLVGIEYVDRIKKSLTGTHRYSYEYNNDGKLVCFTTEFQNIFYLDHIEETYEYDEKNQATGSKFIIDGVVQGESWIRYNDKGLITLIKNSHGEKHWFAYNSNRKCIGYQNNSSKLLVFDEPKTLNQVQMVLKSTHLFNERVLYDIGIK